MSESRNYEICAETEWLPEIPAGAAPGFYNQTKTLADCSIDRQTQEIGRPDDCDITPWFPARSTFESIAGTHTQTRTIADCSTESRTETIEVCEPEPGLYQGRLRIWYEDPYAWDEAEVNYAVRYDQVISHTTEAAAMADFNWAISMFYEGPPYGHYSISGEIRRPAKVCR
mgnify:CR=1 FL=1